MKTDRFGLWTKTDKNGNKMLSGSFRDEKILVLKNDFKQKPTDPDFFLKVLPPKNDDPQKPNLPDFEF